jgi:hypothetical protein
MRIRGSALDLAVSVDPFKRRSQRIDVRLTGEVWPTEPRIRHLEMIQSIVTRMATNSFVAKGWALTVAGAIYGFAASHLNPWIASAGLLSTLGFWWLDAFYLRAERSFRCLYNEAVKPNTDIDLFSLDIRRYRGEKTIRWWSVLSSITLRIFYGAIALVGVGFIIASTVHNASPKGNTIRPTPSMTATVHPPPHPSSSVRPAPSKRS